MTASNPNRPSGRIAGAIVAWSLAFLISAGPLAAQTAPAAPQGEVGAPTPLIPFDSSTRQGSGALPGESLPEVQGIVIDRLQAIDPNALGLLDPDKEGLGPELWRGSDRDTLEALLAAIPGDLRWISLRDLARRALLSRAAPPEPEDKPSPPAADGDTVEAVVEPAPGGEAAVADPRFLSLRIDRLLAIGEVESLRRLLASVPRLVDDEPIQRARADTAFLHGDLDGGCREVRNGVANHAGQLYWPKALVLCQLVSGERAQAQLGLSLLQERGLGAGEEGFLALFDALSGGEAEVPAEAVAEPLPFAALQSVGLSPPEGFLEIAPAGLLVAAALSPKTPLETRIAAGEKAATIGALETERLAALYAEAEFSAEQMLGSDEAGTEGPMERALRYQRIAARKDPGATARALREALSAAIDGDVYLAMVPLVADEFPKVPIQAGLAWFAETAGRTLYAANRIENAGAWYQLARDQAIRNSAAQVAVNRLYPYYRLSGGPTLATGEDSIATWRAGLGEDAADQGGRWEAVLRAGLDGLGGQTGVAAAASATAVAEGPDVDVPETAGNDGLTAFAAIKEAGEAGLRGETVLIALGTIGAVPPEEVDTAALEAVLAALVRSGLPAEARALAIEAAVANGI